MQRIILETSEQLEVFRAWKCECGEFNDTIGELARYRTLVAYVAACKVCGKTMRIEILKGARV